MLERIRYILLVSELNREDHQDTYAKIQLVIIQRLPYTWHVKAKRTESTHGWLGAPLEVIHSSEMRVISRFSPVFNSLLDSNHVSHLDIM